MRVCNVCGNEFDLYDEYQDISVCRKIGYGSKYDEDTLKFDMCCDCFDMVIDMINPICKHSIVKENEL